MLVVRFVLGVLLLSSVLFADKLASKDFGLYLESFDLQERKNMKAKLIEALVMIEEGEAVLIDIRFPDEFLAWNMPFSKNIPLNELPDRLDELPKDKLIITACPHNDRSNIARLYLTMKGYNAKYLSDGLLKAAEFLRGENAVEFIKEYRKSHK
ncbi:MAG: rhodanese-like domain-containing protein [Campylobacterales bacterium]